MESTAANSRPRIAASSYLNTAPLIWSFVRGAQREAVELFTDTAPARCAEMLARAEVDAALVPVIEYQKLSGVSMVADVCVGSKNAVRSVVLVTRRNNLKKVERVALDESSRTSVALVKIIFREFLGFEPEWQISAPDLHSMMQQADAALIIGDPAMRISREQFRVFDLATLWHEFTGLGFVFAMWMVRNDSAEKVEPIDFVAARDEGLNHLDDIVAAQTVPLRLSPEEIAEYLRRNIVFQIDDEMRSGLNLYFDLAHKHKLIPQPKPLEFICSAFPYP
jgi:chorismate dehydratase